MDDRQSADRTGPRALACRLRSLIAERHYEHNARLPPERALAATLNVSRNQLRSALRLLEADGLIWRHVGRGTFVGARNVLNMGDVSFLGGLTSPEKVLESRAAIEPPLAQLAALHASKSDIEQIAHCAERCRHAADWRNYEAWDSKLHDAIAKATRNKLLIFLFDTLNVVRRSIVWDLRRTTTGPSRDHFSFDEHDAIIDAIAARDGDAAAQAMRKHLASVRDRVLPALARAVEEDRLAAEADRDR